MKVNAIRLKETEYYNFNDEDKPYIKDIYSVYAYDPELGVHLCEFTPSYELWYLYTYIDFNDNVPEDDDLKDELDGRYCYEDQDIVIYMHCSDIEKLSEIKECGEFEDMDVAREYLCGNCPI